MIATAAGAVVLLSLSACGNTSTNYNSPEAVAKAAGCTNIHKQPQSDNEYFVSRAITCDYHGHEQTINWFASKDDQARWLQTAKQFGAGDSPHGDHWTVECESSADCSAIAQKLG